MCVWPLHYPSETQSSPFKTEAVLLTEEKQEKELKEAQEGATETQKMSGEALGEDEICRRGRGSQRHKTWGKDKETAGMEEC